MSSLLSAEELLEAKLKRKLLEELKAELDKALGDQIADLDSVISAPRPPTSALQKVAESLVWTQNSRGEYAFTMDRGSNEVKPELRPLLEAIKQSMAMKLQLGRFEYSLSDNPRFLNRRPV